MRVREAAAELAMMASPFIDETGQAHGLSDLHRVQAAIAIAGDDTATAIHYGIQYPQSSEAGSRPIRRFSNQ